MNETVEERQLHTLQSWWERYGVALIVVIALAGGGFVGWDQWRLFEERKIIRASDLYQRVLMAEQEALTAEAEAVRLVREEQALAEEFGDAEEEEPAAAAGAVEEAAEDAVSAEDAGDAQSAEDAEGVAAEDEDGEGEEALDEELFEEQQTEEELIELARQKRLEATGDILLLREQFPETSYALYAMLLQVRYEADAGRFAAAEEILERVRMQSADQELTALATLRLAQALHAQGKGERAVNLLRNEPSRSFTPMFRETIGDILWDQGQASAALAEYRLAERLYRDSINEVPAGLQMKLQELAGSAAGR